MKILIVSATEKEVSLFVKWNGVTPYVWHNFPLHSILVAHTGVGITTSTLAINELIDKYKPDMVIQAGIGGCYPNSGISVGDTVFVESERLADLGVFHDSGFKRVFLDDNELDNPTKYPEIELQRVFSNTVNAACSPYIMIDGISVENMEGYALFYVCLHKKNKFIEIRTISNIVSTSRESWNLNLALENLAHEIKKLCELSYTN